MKKLYIVRHAKSSWEDLSLRDFDRPLNKRGERDAPFMADYCRENGYVPDVLISSDAIRAKTTAAVFCTTFFKSTEKLRLDSSLYHAPAESYFESCHSVEDDIESVMLFGHNPGITYLANSVSSDYIDNVPTCGVLVIHSKAKSWLDIDENNSKLMDFIYPKLLRKKK